jgi:hypothetical protein
LLDVGIQLRPARCTMGSRIASAVALTAVQRYRAAARTCSSQAVWGFPYLRAGQPGLLPP